MQYWCQLLKALRMLASFSLVLLVFYSVLQNGGHSSKFASSHNIKNWKENRNFLATSYEEKILTRNIPLHFPARVDRTGWHYILMVEQMKVEKQVSDIFSLMEDCLFYGKEENGRMVAGTWQIVFASVYNIVLECFGKRNIKSDQRLKTSRMLLVSP